MSQQVWGELSEQEQIALRRAKLAEMRENGIAFPNDFRRNVMAGELHAEYDGTEPEALESAGRV